MKVNGTAKFGIDTQIPGMLYAAILRSPVLGNGPDKVDDAAAKKVKGVVAVIPLDFGVAVLGTNIWATKEAKELLKVVWKKGGKADGYDHDKILAEYAAIAKDYQGQKGLPIHQSGDLDGAFKGAAKKFAADYTNDHVYQATMEPMNTTAWVKKDEVEVWSPTQAPGVIAFVGAAIAKMPPEKIKVHTTFLGGGFGRRLEQDFVVDAIVLSKITGKPVKVVWSREDDVQHGFYRPAAAQRLEAAVDAGGKIVGWRHRIVSPSILARANPPAFEAMKGNDAAATDGHQLTYQIPTSCTTMCARIAASTSASGGRSVPATSCSPSRPSSTSSRPMPARTRSNTGCRCCQTPTPTRSSRKWPRWRAGARSGTAGRSASPIRSSRTTGTATSPRSPRCRSTRIPARSRSTRCGRRSTPASRCTRRTSWRRWKARSIFGVSHALKEKITIKGGAVQESNFHDYPVMRMDEVPEIEIKVMANGKSTPGGIGEVGLPLTGPAIANARGGPDRQAAAPPAVLAGDGQGDAQIVVLDRAVGIGRAAVPQRAAARAFSGACAWRRAALDLAAYRQGRTERARCRRVPGRPAPPRIQKREQRRAMSNANQRAPRKPEPYIPDIGRAVVKPRLEGKGKIINLSLNESSFGSSPRAVAAAQERCERLNRYPDVASTELRQAIGAHFGLDPDRIVCGNGSEELLDIIARLYARPGDEILFTEYGFIQFPIVTMRVGATPVKAPAPDPSHRRRRAARAASPTRRASSISTIPTIPAAPTSPPTRSSACATAFRRMSCW